MEYTLTIVSIITTLPHKVPEDKILRDTPVGFCCAMGWYFQVLVQAGHGTSSIVQVALIVQNRGSSLKIACCWAELGVWELQAEAAFGVGVEGWVVRGVRAKHQFLHTVRAAAEQHIQAPVRHRMRENPSGGSEKKPAA